MTKPMLSNVDLILRDGEQVHGRLMRRFSPQTGEVAISCKGEAQVYDLEDVACMVVLNTDSSEPRVALPGERDEHVILKTGQEFDVRVMEHHSDPLGLFSSSVGFFAFPREDAHIQNYFFINDAVLSRELDRPIGDLLHQENILEKKDLDWALDTQKIFRETRIGDVLVEQTSTPREVIEQTLGERSESDSKKQHVGEILVSAEVISRDELAEALREQHRRKNKRLGEILADMGLVSEEQFLMALAVKFRTPFVDLDVITPTAEALGLLSEEQAKKYHCVPISVEGKRLNIATDRITDLEVLKGLGFVTGYSIKVHAATARQVNELIERFYAHDKAFAEMFNVELVEEHDEVEDVDAKRLNEEENAPVIRMANHILLDGVKQGASDIHIYCTEQALRIDFRIHGLISVYQLLDKNIHPLLLGRFKILASMDLTEHRRPQDGRIHIKLSGRLIEFRVSCMPGVLGENMVLRVLDKGGRTLNIKSLGISEADQQRIHAITHRNHGLFLATGPTGSGKSTTLLSVLSDLTNLPKRIFSLEDPVEADVKGVIQIQVNHKIHFTFASGLRNLLRHDPDIIMVGEIRDAETALIAVEAAMTGHMLLSSLHTNSAVGAFSRLINLGLPAYLLADTLRGVMGQQLVPKLCQHCVQEVPPQAFILEELNRFGIEYGDFPDHVCPGCKACNHTGIGGRVLVYELLEVLDPIPDLVARGASENEIMAVAKGHGMRTMADYAIEKAREGLLPLEAILPLLSS